MTREDRYRLGIDIGGTFTDFVLVDDAGGDIKLHKCLTTPEDPSTGALRGAAELVEAAGIGLHQVTKILHGTTLVTNAIIERRGAGLGLITTAGFRDLLEMGTEQRYDIYDLFLDFPEPLVPRRHRFEVTERMSRDGEVVHLLDLDGLKEAADRLVADGIGAIAICFCTATAIPHTSKRQVARSKNGIRTSRCRFHPRSWRSFGNISAPSPPAPTLMSSP